MNARLASLCCLLACLLSPVPAFACGGPIWCRTLTSSSPADGANDVALNSELRVRYDSTYGEAIAPTLVHADGSEVAVTWVVARVGNEARTTTTNNETWIGRANAPLAADTTYTLRHRYAACPSTNNPACGLCTSDTSIVLSTFTTGSESLLGAPKPPVLASPVTLEGFQDSGNSSCGPYARCMNKFSLAPVGSNERVRIYNGDTLVSELRVDQTLEQAVAVHVPGSNGYPSEAHFSQFGAASYQLYVVDAAGNRSTPLTLDIPACEEPSEDDDGCSLHGSQPSKTLSLLLSFFATLWLTRRRRA